MIKNIKKISILFVSVILFAFAMLLAGCSSNSNEGRIRGLDGGRFVAHFNNGVVCSFFAAAMSEERYRINVINSRNQLIEWLVELEQEDGFLMIDGIDFDIDLHDAEIFAQYCDKFFEENQLIFINFWAGILNTEIRRVEFRNNTLNVEVRDILPNGVDVIFRPGRLHFLTLEISKINDYFDVTFYRHSR